MKKVKEYLFDVAFTALLGVVFIAGYIHGMIQRLFNVSNEDERY